MKPPGKLTIEGVPDWQAIDMCIAEIKANAPRVPMMHRVELLKRSAMQRTGEWPTHLFINEHDWQALESELDYQALRMREAASQRPVNLPLLPMLDGLQVVKLAGALAMRVGRIDAEETR